MNSNFRKRPRTRRSESDIRELYEDQLQFLKASAAQYDAGQLTSYRRMATALRVLLHETGTSRSLISQMSLETRQFLTCSASPRPENLMVDCDLIALLIPTEAGKRAMWISGLDNWAMEFTSFESWWSDPVINDGKACVFSRSSLVLHVANQDGGSHVDPEIDQSFEEMRKTRFTWTSGRHITEHPDRAAIRTIAHEAIKSLDNAYKRRRPPEPSSTLRSLALIKGNPPPRREVVSYHLTDPHAPCPCLSGMTFSGCHARGAQEPREGGLRTW